MLMKQNALDLHEKMTQLVEVSMNAMEKKILDPAQLYKNLKQLRADLEQSEAIIKREPNV